MARGSLTEYRVELSVMLLLAFGMSAFLGLLGLLLGPELPDAWGFFQSVVDVLGNWLYWLAAVGAFGLIFSVWWFADYIFKVRKLKRLIDTTSKAKFIKNIDSIEYIAWRLPNKYKTLMANKKRELRVK